MVPTLKLLIVQWKQLWDMEIASVGTVLRPLLTCLSQYFLKCGQPGNYLEMYNLGLLFQIH